MAKRKQYNKLKDIIYGERPKLLLVGNGINLPFDGAISTDKIVIDEWNKNHTDKLPQKKADSGEHELWKLPFNLQVVAATKDHVQGCMNGLSQIYIDQEVSEKHEKLIKDILNAGFDVILSTNYSLEFEKVAISDFSRYKAYKNYKTTQEQSNQQEQFNIFRCTELPYGNRPLLWHIHGTSLRKNSLVMGQLYYGKLLSEVISRAHVVATRYASCTKGMNSFSPKSWIDFFLISDVYIMGFAIDYSEIDIWWLLSYKKKVFPDTKTFVYKPYINADQKLLLECYGVEMPKVEFDEALEDGYIRYYQTICNEFKKKTIQ